MRIWISRITLNMTGKLHVWSTNCDKSSPKPAIIFHVADKINTDHNVKSDFLFLAQKIDDLYNTKAFSN